MKSYLFYMALVLFLFLFAGCGPKPLPPVSFTPPEKTIDYLEEVKPVLVKRCVVCHSCYNSPCQLKLSSFEGLDRGASKKAVYNATRRKTMDPTRLFMDAQSTSQWREKDFHSVTKSNTCNNENDSIMMQILSHKVDKPVNHGDSFKPEEDELTCAEDGPQLGTYLKKHPNRGMPYGFPPLSKDEFDTIAGWLVQGANGPDDKQTEKLKSVPPEDLEKITTWEKFLNTDSPKHAMTARYLYEHLFLAHIKFDTDSNAFYELVRYTINREGEARLVATDRPYDDPGEGHLEYRLRKIHSTIVHKTHMVFDFSDAELERFKELFINTEWLKTPEVIGYQNPKINANPFLAFEQIPVRYRYQFLLDNIHFFMMTFIRGPVCKGQVALNVVRDHFWLLFLDPEYDLTVQYPGVLQTNKTLLKMPLVEDNDFKRKLALLSKKYRKKSTKYVKKRREFYTSHYRYKPLDQNAIWTGRKITKIDKPLHPGTPLLTVFRHFDSASVHAGPLGNLPRTLWVMDYPLVERIYYSLVAGFNVYGTKVHQASTRIYMDELRQEAETYFLDFMPLADREAMMQNWYGEMDIKQTSIAYEHSELEPGVDFQTVSPKREFIEDLVNNHFIPESEISFDDNYLKAGEQHPGIPLKFKTMRDYIQGFRAVSKAGTSFFSKVSDHDANLAYVRIVVDKEEKNDIYLSMIVNRWHDDVTSLYGEELRLDPHKDSAVFIKDFVGSYPNYFFEVKLSELHTFLELLRDYDGKKNSIMALSKFGINRASDNFWQVYDRFQNRFLESDPVHAGLFDLNRYYHKAYRVDNIKEL